MGKRSNEMTPRGWLNEELFDRVRQRLAAGDGMTTAAHAALLTRADAALEAPAASVRDNGGSPHFRQDAVYVPGRDGVINDEADRRSGHVLNRFSADALDLATAYRIGGDARYLVKALELIHAWCINENTYMVPDGFVFDPATPGAQHGGDIIFFHAFYRAFQAMALLRDDPGWALSAHAAVLRWVRAMAEPQRRRMFFRGREMTNNWEDARLLHLAFAASALGDLDVLLEVFDRWKAILPLKMTDEGELPRETMRTRSMHYTLFALHSTTLVAELAAGYGCNLYDHTVNGRGLRRAIDYATGYLLNLPSWPFQNLQPLDSAQLRDGLLATFELAHAHWGDPRYLRVIEAWGGRPVTDSHATLLHGIASSCSSPRSHCERLSTPRSASGNAA
jgi:hypothetical protein